VQVAWKYDIAVVGGGFSGVATLANLVRDAKIPFSACVISRDPEGVFGPAYSTPRMEHLLNVHAKGMGLFAENHRHFLEWLEAEGIEASPDQYMPRPLYGRYLASVLADTKKLAIEKGITLDWFQGEVEDIVDQPDYLAIMSGSDIIGARQVVLAIGNSLKAREDIGPENLIRNVWHYDFSRLGPRQKNIALIGSGLTAADTIISILNAGWQGTITCYSGRGSLPKSHLPAYDIAQRIPGFGSTVISQRLSDFMRLVRAEIAKGERDWRYVIDSLRPLSHDIWRSLPETDRRRAAAKYFTLWNIHRHRYAPSIAASIDAAIAAGKLKMVAARVKDTADDNDRLRITLENGAVETFDLAFKCTGVNYRVDSNPLLKKLADKGMLKKTPDGNGVRASDNFIVYQNRPNTIYALGAPLFGLLFETTAVPELREEAKTISAALLRAAAAR
jgi:uncharacterized NAD(P)/FAD-binding protein YdhS